MNENTASSDRPDTVLLVENEVLVRLAISEYLRHCGYRVIEAASASEALTLLAEPDIGIDVVFSAVELGEETDGFALARRVRTEWPGLNVILTGNFEKAAREAGDLCEEGPHLKKPYEPQQVVDWIKRLRNLRRDK
jgi:CheY-like chemotaxis protein